MPLIAGIWFGKRVAVKIYAVGDIWARFNVGCLTDDSIFRVHSVRSPYVYGRF